MRRAGLTAVQILITVGIVWWVFHDPAKRAEMAATVVRANPWWLLAGFLAYGVTEFVSGVRWQILLRVQGFRLPLRRVFALTMIGECLESQGALPEAVVQYKEALNSGPVADAESTQLYYLLGSAFERMGDTSEALYFFEKVARRGAQFRDVARRIDLLRGDRPAP